MQLAALIIFVLCVVVALAVGVMAAWSDFRSLTIPNIYPLIIVLAFAAAALDVHFLAPGIAFETPLRHLAAGAIIFVVTFILFTAGTFGGGDSKLLSAFALWTGLRGLMGLLFYTACIGGMIGLAAILIRKFRPFSKTGTGSWIGRLQAGENRVPYGVAISIGAFLAFLERGYTDFHTFSLFLER